MGEKINSHQDLKVYQESLLLVIPSTINFTFENKDLKNRIYFIKNMLSKVISSLKDKNKIF